MDGNPTAENIARLIYEKTREAGLPVVEVVLWETENCCAAYGDAGDARPARAEATARALRSHGAIRLRLASAVMQSDEIAGAGLDQWPCPWPSSTGFSGKPAVWACRDR